MAAEGPKSGITGSVLGIITFLAGIALLAMTFKFAIDMFGTDPAALFGLQQGEAIDLGRSVTVLMGIIVRVLLLVVMAIVGGLIASRGIRLYADARHSAHPPRYDERKGSIVD
jgi:hypothetical protein